MPAKGYRKPGAKEASVKKRAFNAQPEQKKRRAERNASRRKMVEAGKAHKGDGKDVDHRNHNTKDQSASNLKMMDKSKNRAKNQHSASYKKGK
jgi:hypothetical protein